MAPSSRDDCTYFSIKSSRLMGAVMPFIALVQSRLTCVDFPYSPRAMTLIIERIQERRKILETLYIFYIFLVDLLKTPVSVCVRRLYGFFAL